MFQYPGGIGGNGKNTNYYGMENIRSGKLKLGDAASMVGHHAKPSSRTIWFGQPDAERKVHHVDSTWFQRKKGRIWGGKDNNRIGGGGVATKRRARRVAPKYFQ